MFGLIVAISFCRACPVFQFIILFTQIAYFLYLIIFKIGTLYPNIGLRAGFEGIGKPLFFRFRGHLPTMKNFFLGEGSISSFTYYVEYRGLNVNHHSVDSFYWTFLLSMVCLVERFSAMIFFSVQVMASNYVGFGM